MNAAVIINSSAGAEKSEENARLIRDAFKELDTDCEVHILAGSEIESTVKKIIESGIDILIAAGGDGTVSSIAGILAGGKTPLGVLPCGTLNHFAKDIGIPMDLSEAVKVTVNGKATLVDTAEVNGIRFINNSSIGLYPSIVKDRVAEQEQHSRSKLSALFFAFICTFKRFPLYSVEIKTDDKLIKLKTPIVFVGNNRYIIEFYSIGERSKLDEGVLSLYIARCKMRLCMLKLALLSLIGKINQHRDFEESYTSEITVKTNKKLIDVSLDGEVLKMTSPLSYKIIPKSLTVMVPLNK